MMVIAADFRWVGVLKIALQPFVCLEANRRS